MLVLPGIPSSTCFAVQLTCVVKKLHHVYYKAFTIAPITFCHKIAVEIRQAFQVASFQEAEEELPCPSVEG